jgi:hypothetical protein
MKILVGDHLGLLKQINLNTKKIEDKYGVPQADNSVLWMDKILNTNNSLYNYYSTLSKKEFNIVNIQNQVKIFNIKLEDIEKKVNKDKSSNGHAYDISRFYKHSNKDKTFQTAFKVEDQESSNYNFFLGNNKGEIAIIKHNVKEIDDNNNGRKRKNSNVSNNSKNSKRSKNSNKSNKKFEEDFELLHDSYAINLFQDINEHQLRQAFLEKIVPCNLNYAGNNAVKNYQSQNLNSFYCLFQEAPLKIYDINKEKFSFISRNVPNDELSLKVPIWDTDVVQSLNQENVFYVSTGYGKVIF